LVEQTQEFEVQDSRASMGLQVESQVGLEGGMKKHMKAETDGGQTLSRFVSNKERRSVAEVVRAT